MRRYLIIITIMLLLSGCSSLKEDNQNLVETNRNLENQLQELEEQISEVNNDLASSQESFSNLEDDYEEIVAELSESNRIIEEVANERDSIADAVEDKQIIDVDTALSDEELIEWNNRLANIMYFIPDFIEPESIDKTELLEGVFLYGAYEEKIDFGNPITDEELNEICINLFGESLLEHQSFEVAEYVDGEYIAPGFSYDETRISYVNKVISIGSDDLVILQQFSMGESEWSDNHFTNISGVIDSIHNETFRPEYLGEYIVVIDSSNSDDIQLKMKMKLTD